MTFHSLWPVIEIIIKGEFFSSTNISLGKDADPLFIRHIPPLDDTIGAGMVDEASLITEAACIDIDIVLKLHHVKLPNGDISKVALLTLTGGKFQYFSNVFDNKLACLNGFGCSKTQSPNGFRVENFETLFGSLG